MDGKTGRLMECWNGLFRAFAFIHSTVDSKKWSLDDKHILQGYDLPHCCCIFLNSRKFEANLIHKRSVPSSSLFCNKYLGLYLGSKPNNFANKVRRTFSTAENSLMTRSWNSCSRDQFLVFIHEWNQRSEQGLKAKPSQQTSGIIVDRKKPENK